MIDYNLRVIWFKNVTSQTLPKSLSAEYIMIPLN